MERSTDNITVSARLAGLLGVIVALGLAVAVPSGAAEGAEEPAARKAAPASDDEALLRRALAYWEARSGGADAVLEFYAPPEKGGPTRPKDISEFGNVGYKQWHIEGVEVEGDRGVVKINIEASFPLALPGKLRERVLNRTLQENWIKIDGTWYKQPIPRGFAPRRSPEPVPGQGEEDAPPAAADPSQGGDGS